MRTPWLLACCIFLLAAKQGNTQSLITEFSKVVDFLPPPPNAAAITKAGFFNINKNTGVPNINVPVYTLKGKHLSLDIGLNYATNGIKVDEVASRSGMGWALLAGGVISRVIRGSRDEAVPRKYPWSSIGANWATYNYFKGVSTSNNYVGMDAEPDLFSFNFNGISGSFVFDGTMNVVQLPVGNLKIEYDFNSGAPWNFKITTAEGVMYYFGGAQATEKTKRQTTCGKNFDDFFPTAWYLTKIEHPTGETIQLTYAYLEYTYDTGLSESMELVTEYQSCNGQTAPKLNVNSCTNYTQTRGYVLTSINSEHRSVEFTYTTRSDCSDYLLTGIYVRNKIHSTSIVASYSFIYNYYNSVPYLSTLAQTAEDGSPSLAHRFLYNDPGARPARLSKSQDHWGFYNGKSNTTLLPKLPELQQGSSPNYYYFTNANADRSADFEYAAKGMLVKILYPTGGADSILYESPGTTTLPATNGARTYFTCEVKGTNHHDPGTRTIPFTLKASQQVTLDINILSIANPWDPLHQVGTVSVNPIGGANVFYEVFQPGTTTTRNITLPAGSYNLVLRANGYEQTTRTKITYHSASNISPAPNVSSYPGVRVKSILTGTPGEVPVYKRYYYAYIDNLNGSSLQGSFQPVYLKEYYTASQTSCVYRHNMLYSNSIRNLFSYSSGSVSYAAVVEGIGENFEGGATETVYGVSWDQMGAAVWNNDILDAPFTNGSIFYNGKVRKETIFRKAINGTLQPVKRTENIYKEDLRRYKGIDGYVIFRRSNYPVEADTNCCVATAGMNLVYYDAMNYVVHAPWIYIDSVKETNWSDNGGAELTTTTKSYYDNIQHLQITRSVTRNSKGVENTTTLRFAGDFAAAGNVYNDMLTRHMIGIPLYKKTEETTIQLTENRTHYAAWSPSMLLPSVFQSSTKNNPLENVGEITGYDSKGNIVEYKGKEGVVNSFIWGYDYYYPVARVAGASYSQVVSQLTAGVAGLQALTGAALLTELHRIRTGLPQALVTTYTYDPRYGATTIVNESNRATYYEYDGFGRLKIIRDNDNNIQKRNEYSYAGSDITAPLFLFFNDQVNADFTCQNCPSGTKGATIGFSAPAGKFFSTLSKQDANLKAQAYVNASGQLYANLYGFCDNTICSGQGYAMINCNCELGQIDGISCSDNPDGTWNQTYRYKWSNNTYSTETYTRVMQPCNLPERKKIGCNCVNGIKTYRSSTQNPNGTWTCVYYYRYSDNTISPDYTETTATVCGNPD